MSTTPPPQAPPLHSTPVHTHSRTTDRHILKYENRNAALLRLSNEMAPYFVGPMPPQDFLATFLPPDPPSGSEPSCNASSEPPRGPRPPPFKKEMFSTLTKTSRESEMYQKFVCFRTLLFPEINPIFLD